LALQFLEPLELCYRSLCDYDDKLIADADGNLLDITLGSGTNELHVPKGTSLSLCGSPYWPSTTTRPWGERTRTTTRVQDGLVRARARVAMGGAVPAIRISSRTCAGRLRLRPCCSRASASASPTCTPSWEIGAVVGSEKEKRRQGVF
jgi:hypothetical protein